MTTKLYKLLLLLVLMAVFGCATYQSQVAPAVVESVHRDDSITPAKRFYLIGDAGIDDDGEASKALKLFAGHIRDRDTSEDILVFLGDNLYQKGLPPKGAPGREEAELRLDKQVEVARDFQGRVIFIPGNHDWYNKGLEGLKRQEEYLEKALDDNEVFQPENGCPLERIDLNEEVVLLVIDSQWYLEDWDRHPTMNDECEITSRQQFFTELKGELKKNSNKTIVLAMHHPAITYGPHGGYFNARTHLFPHRTNIPLPGLGSLVAQMRSQGGVSPQDRYNERYDELMDRIMTLSHESDRVILVAGHEHTLQYNELGEVKQIVSGAGSKQSPAALGPGAQFVSGQQGFAILDVYADRSSSVEFYTADEGMADQSLPAFSAQVHPPRMKYDTGDLPETFPSSKQTTIYPRVYWDVSDGFKWAWGEHYRDVYGTTVDVPVATLDTLYGGLTVQRKGGGFQTRSLRVIDKEGRNFALRAVKKSAVQFIQNAAFQRSYVKDEFRETITEDLVMDLYTASHPFGTFAVSRMADAVGVYHTNPFLFYMPKHPALGDFNEEFGDELYIIEERPDDGFVDRTSFGNPDAIESTDDVLKKIRSDEKYFIDKEAMIRARLFDMVLADWDRHSDQWRWARFDITKDSVVYRPIPRDRDQAFSNYDGAVSDVLKALVPVTRKFAEFSPSTKDVKWLNLGGIKIDRTFLQTATRQDWTEQALRLKEQLTDEVIKEAFTTLPREVQGEGTDRIVEVLMKRRDQIVDVAERYYQRLASLVIMTATDKDDRIEVVRYPDRTLISISRIIDAEAEPAYKQREVFPDETSEIWIYALDDDDQIVVSGDGKAIFTRIIGGQNNDVYTISGGKRVKVYDHLSKPNTIKSQGSARFRFTDLYANNHYDHNRYIDRVNSIIPLIGFNPDDGLQIGVTDVYTVKGFKQKPFHSRHRLRAGYYFATSGFDIAYTGEFAQAVGSWNAIIDVHLTSENFTRNFFGFGNQSPNPDDELGLDYNRVKTGSETLRFGVAKNGFYGSRFEAVAGFERIEVDETADRFISEEFMGGPEVFERTLFANLEVNYQYNAIDNAASPTRGMYFRIKTGLRTNMERANRTYGYIHPALQFFNALNPTRTLVLRTAVEGQFNLGRNYEFYQAAVLGANTGLRGFRTERFSGDSALGFSGDLRYRMARFKTGLLPLELGVFTGGDVGRVWFHQEDTNNWHGDYGLGFWLSAADTVAGQLGLFNSNEGLRVTFGIGFDI